MTNLAYPARPNLLVIPMPQESLARCELCQHKNHQLLVLENTESLPVSLLPPRDTSARALFRWLLGHHIAVCVWTLLADTLGKLTDWPKTDTNDTHRAALLMNAYTGMLVYAGSCSPDIYKTAIRPLMIDCHPSFSGFWARDYEKVSILLKRLAPPAASPFGVAWRTNHKVHMQQARRLVPGGKSLLQASGNVYEKVTDTERGLFDAFFLIRRAEACLWEFHVQMVRRISQCLCDLDTDPLPERDFAFPSSEVVNSLQHTLYQLADLTGAQTQ